MSTIVQKLEKKVPDNIQKAIKYFSLISCLNGLKLTRKQIQLLAFTAIRGTITSPASRQEFITLFNSSLASLENLKGSLYKLGWMVKVDNKYKVNPQVYLDFSKDILLQINLISG